MRLGYDATTYLPIYLRTYPLTYLPTNYKSTNLRYMVSRLASPVIAEALPLCTEEKEQRRGMYLRPRSLI